jgi:hypothetical protein
MSDFINKVITIASKEEKKTKTGTNTLIYLTDQDGDKYTLFKKKKDGTLSSAAEQLKDMDLDEGSTVQISWVVEAYTGSDNKPHTTNKVTGFRETSDVPTAKAKSPQPDKQTYHKEEEKDDEFWNKKAVGKCQTLFLQAYIQSGKTISDAKLQVIPARQLAELVVYGVQQASEPLPQETPEPEMAVEDIPF